jgi:hypothetical protein
LVLPGFVPPFDGAPCDDEFPCDDELPCDEEVPWEEEPPWEEDPPKVVDAVLVPGGDALLRLLTARAVAICRLLELGVAGLASTGTVGFCACIGIPNPGTGGTIGFAGWADQSAPMQRL